MSVHMDRIETNLQYAQSIFQKKIAIDAVDTLSDPVTIQVALLPASLIP